MESNHRPQDLQSHALPLSYDPEATPQRAIAEQDLRNRKATFSRKLALFTRGISSIGRVRALQARGTGIETPMLHLVFYAFSFGQKPGQNRHQKTGVWGN